MCRFEQRAERNVISLSVQIRRNTQMLRILKVADKAGDHEVLATSTATTRGPAVSISRRSSDSTARDLANERPKRERDEDGLRNIDRSPCNYNRKAGRMRRLRRGTCYQKQAVSDSSAVLSESLLETGNAQRIYPDFLDSPESDCWLAILIEVGSRK